MSLGVDGLSTAWAIVRPDLIAAIGFLLAAAVTVHVLLHKRDVAAAVGWIGLAFLSPVLGPLLYVLFGINRVGRRARRLRDAGGVQTDATPRSTALVPERLASLDRATQTIAGQPPATTESVVVLRCGDEAYPAMIAAIEGAGHSVGLTTYILDVDAVGRAFLDALAAAKERGVEVRVLVDGIGSGYFFPAAYGELRRRGVTAERFMHSSLPWRMPFLNLRSHKKLLVVDGRVAFLGGMNIGADNLASAPPERRVVDTHFRIAGPVCGQLVADFAQDWAFAAGEELEGPKWWPTMASHDGPRAMAVSSGPDEDIEKIEFTMLQAFACAESSIRLMTPYFLPSEPIVSSLAMAAMRGIDVDIVLPAKSNHRIVDWAEQAHIEPLLRNGVRIWRNPPPFDHSKLLVIDDCWSFIGSANLDVRSLRLNFELNVATFDGPTAGAVSALIRSRSVDQVTIGDLEQRPRLAQLRDAAARLALPYL